MASDYRVEMGVTEAVEAMSQALPLAKTLRIVGSGDFRVSLAIPIATLDLVVFGPTHIRLLSRASETAFVMSLPLISNAWNLTPADDDNKQYNLDLRDGPTTTVAFLFDQF